MSSANYDRYNPSNPVDSRQGQRLYSLLQIRSHLKYNDIADAILAHEWMWGVNSGVSYKTIRKDIVAFNLRDETPTKESIQQMVDFKKWINYLKLQDLL